MHGNLLRLFFSKIIRALHKLMLDDVKIIRTTVLEVLPTLGVADSVNLEPFESEISMYLHSILTHVKDSIRLDGLKYLCFWAPLMQKSIQERRGLFLPIFLRILSNGGDTGSSSTNANSTKFYASINSDPVGKAGSLEVSRQQS